MYAIEMIEETKTQN